VASIDSHALTMGIVLAAGAGERMGGNKARLLLSGFGEEPLGALHARRMREAGCSGVVLVTRPDVAALFAGDARMRVVTSTAREQAGSLALALDAMALDAAPDAIVVVTPVDALPAKAETIEQLVAAVEAGVEAATPRRGGRGGHPVVARARVIAGACASGLPLRDVLAALGVQRLRVDVDDPAIGTDLDSPADVVRVTGAPPRFWGRP